jgi:hypothetical protein
LTPILTLSPAWHERGHGLSSTNGPIEPSRAEIPELVVEFFDFILK